MLVLALRLRLVRRVAEWDAACVDMQCACPVSEQIVGEIPVQRLAGQTDGFVRGLQLAVPAFERFRRLGSRRLHILAAFPVDHERRIRTVWHAGRVHPVDLVADLEARILDRAGEPMIGAAGRERRPMPARLQDAQDILPQVHVERDACGIEAAVHETDLIRRVGNDGIHAVVR